MQEYPEISDFISDIVKTETVRKSRVLTREQQNEFLTNAPDEDRYWLVRKAAMVVSILGGLRGKELRSLRRSHFR